MIILNIIILLSVIYISLENVILRKKIKRLKRETETINHEIAQNILRYCDDFRDAPELMRLELIESELNDPFIYI